MCIPACTAQGHLYPSMHWPGDVSTQGGGVSVRGGSAQGGCLSGGCLPRRVSAQGVSAWGVCVSQYAMGQTPPLQAVIIEN